MEQEEQEIKRAKSTAYRYLMIRPRSRREVEKKLSDRGFPAATVRTVLEHLSRLGYVDDEKFARLWAASRVRTRGFGQRRIAQELRTKGIGRELVHEVLKDLFGERSEIEVARREAEKKLRTMGRFDPFVRRRRLAGFLERKGYTADTIRTVLRDKKDRT